MPSKDHKLLIKTITKLAKQDKWRKIPKSKGEVTEKSITKTGNIKFTLDNITFYVLKRNKNLFEQAMKVQEGDIVTVALRTQLGKYYCIKLTRKKKEKKLSDWL